MWINTGDTMDNRIVSESFDLSTLGTGLEGGYRQSKWVSEMLVSRARIRGVPILVVRPGTLGGLASLRDQLNRDNYHLGRDKGNFINRIIIGCEQFGYAPITRSNFSETPIDWFSYILGHLVLKPDAWSNLYPAFHIKNPHALTDMKNSRVKTSLKWIPLEEWAPRFKNYARTEAGANNPLTPLISYLCLLYTSPSPRDRG